MWNEVPFLIQPKKLFVLNVKELGETLEIKP